MRKSMYSDDPTERKRLTAAAWKARNPHRPREISAKFREQNLEKVKLNAKRYERTPEAQEKRRLRQRNQNVNNRLKAIEWAGGVCADCGQAYHHSAMDFHHLDPAQKESQGGKGIQSNLSWARILKELVKTVLLCANCHRIRHYRERNPECPTLK